MNPKTLFEAIGSARSVKLGLAANPESSSAWVKTLIDPAHAREYGCRGIPDENQQPTLVLNGRDTSTYTSANMPGVSYNYYYLADEATSWTSVAASNVSNFRVTDVYLMQAGIISPLITIYYGRGDVSTSTRDIPILLMSRSQQLVVLSNSSARLVAQSSTVTWVGKEIDQAGYFEAGYILPSVWQSTTSDYNQQIRVNLDELSSLVSYTGKVQDGVYVISTFNDYDLYRYWKGTNKVLYTFTFKGAALTTTSYSEYCNPQAVGSLRPYFVHYSVYCQDGTAATASGDWALRITTSEVVERFAGYAAGGSDSAVYDRASVEDMIALYDSFDLIFPASYNDLKKVWGFVKAHAPKAAGFAASVLRHFPQTKALGEALHALVGEDGSIISKLQSDQSKMKNIVSGRKNNKPGKRNRGRGKKKGASEPDVAYL